MYRDEDAEKYRALWVRVLAMHEELNIAKENFGGDLVTTGPTLTKEGVRITIHPTDRDPYVIKWDYNDKHPTFYHDPREPQNIPTTTKEYTIYKDPNVDAYSYQKIQTRLKTLSDLWDRFNKSGVYTTHGPTITLAKQLQLTAWRLADKELALVVEWDWDDDKPRRCYPSEK